MQLKFIRFNEKAKIPTRAYPTDSGADIYMLEAGILKAGETQVIPIGFGIEVPNGYNAYIQARTSLAKKGITIEQCAIDSGYNGELHIIIHNLSDKTFNWYENDRLGYLLVYPIAYPSFVEEEGYRRGNLAFGSSGK